MITQVVQSQRFGMLFSLYFFIVHILSLFQIGTEIPVPNSNILAYLDMLSS